MAKHIPSIKRVFITVIPFGIIVCAGCAPKIRDPLPDVPRVVLWAWEEPEDLRWIDPHEVGVAFFAGSLRIDDDGAVFRPRLQPLRVPGGTSMIAVVRVVGMSTRAPLDRTAAAIADAARLPRVRAIQIDFDALASQRDFYAELVKAVRAKLPPRMPLLITALVSWCIGDRWLDRLAVDEAVPMYFRMGSEQGLRGIPLREPLCQNSVGISTDELRKVQLRHRLFLFHPRPWTSESLRAALSEVQRW